MAVESARGPRGVLDLLLVVGTLLETLDDAAESGLERRVDTEGEVGCCCCTGGGRSLSRARLLLE